MMEVVSIVAGIICGILAGVIVSLLLIIWMAGFEERWNNRPQIDVQGNFQLWHAGGQEATQQFTIVERQLLGDGKRR